MAGGLFGRSFVFNIKCIIFSLLCILLFLINPSKIYNKKYLISIILLIIFVLAYVLMAWYDYYYDCRILPLKKAKYSLTELIKPDAHILAKQVEYIDDMKDTRQRKIIIYLFHIILIIPLITYISYYQSKSHTVSFILLGVLTVFTLLYHSTELIYYSHKINNPL